MRRPYCVPLWKRQLLLRQQQQSARIKLIEQRRKEKSKGNDKWGVGNTSNSKPPFSI